ncbi:NEAT domain-containing protein [Streptococcus phocae subsp. salmonis]
MKNINKYAVLALSAFVLTQSGQTVSSEGNLVSSKLVTKVAMDDDILLFEEIGPYADNAEGKKYYKNIEKIIIDKDTYDHQLEGDYTYDINYKGIKVRANHISDGKHDLVIVNPTDGGVLVTFEKEGNKVTFISAKEADEKDLSATESTKHSEKEPKKSSKKTKESSKKGSALANLGMITKLEKKDGSILFPQLDRYSSDKAIQKFVHQITSIRVNDKALKDNNYGSVANQDAWVSDMKGIHIGTKALAEGENKIVISATGFEDMIITVTKSGDTYTFVSAQQKQSSQDKKEDDSSLDFSALEKAIAEAEAIINSEANKDSVKALTEKLQVIKDSYKSIDNKPLLQKTYDLLMDLIHGYKGEELQISNLKEGTYTVSFRANKENTDDSSMLQGAFDKKAKLVVKKDGQMELSLLNTALGQFLMDFSIESNGKYPTSVRKQVGNKDINNNYVRSEFTFPISDLEKMHKGAVLVSAMGGQESDLHHYEKYTKLDMTFGKTVTKGWTGYQAEIDDKEKGVGSERLERVLVKLGNDLNGDGKMSPDELAQLSGELHLDHYDLTDISLLKHVKNVTELHLEGNHISDIPKDTFSQMKNLRFLNLRSNDLTHLDKDIFANNNQLSELYLSSNFMPTLEEDLFKGLSQLTQLDLSKNRINTLSDGLFKGLSKVTSLGLAENNLEEVSETVLVSLKSLNFIDLSENHLSALPKALEKLDKLGTIVASRNHIVSIDNIDFKQLPKLSILDLSTNEIASLPKEAFKSNTKLTKLDFFNNLLTHVDESSLPNLKELNLDLKFNQLGQVSDKIKSLIGQSKITPQKTIASIKASLNGSGIDYHQDFSLLDLYYWEQKTNSVIDKEIPTVEEYHKFLKEKGSDTASLLNEMQADWNIIIQLQKKTSNGRYVTVSENVLTSDPQDQLDGHLALKGEGTYRIRKSLVTKRFANKREYVYLVSNDVTVTENQLAHPEKQDGKAKGLDINHLKDGVYYLNAKMLKDDLESESMSNNAIDHRVKLIVDKGVYRLEVEFKSLKIGQMMGYLGELSYFTDGYQRNTQGKPVGHKEKATVISYFTDNNGQPIADNYGKDYPKVLTFNLINQAKKDGLVPLQVFVPIMDAISKGKGSQTVFMKLDLQSLTSDKADHAHPDTDHAKNLVPDIGIQPKDSPQSPNTNTGNGDHKGPGLNNLNGLLSKKPSSDAKDKAPSKDQDKKGTDKLKSLIASHDAEKDKKLSDRKDAPKSAEASHRKGRLPKFVDSRNNHMIIGLVTFCVAAIGLVIGRKKLF